MRAFDRNLPHLILSCHLPNLISHICFWHCVFLCALSRTHFCSDKTPTKSSNGLSRWEQERFDRIAKEEAEPAERIKKEEAELAYRREKDERKAKSREILKMAKLLMSTLMPRS